ncbi:hypothetical protein HY837_01065 [archaeon]|nr:hypothetical protein [archaeon]
MVWQLNKAVYSDFDGTLSKSDISLEFTDFLFENKLYSEKCYSEHSKLVENFKSGKISYVDWNKDWAFYWGEGLKGQKEDVIKNAAVDFYPQFRKNIYPSSFEIMQEFGNKKYHRVTISVSAYEVIRIASEDLQMDDALATKCEIIDGVYTGRVLTRLHLPGGKKETVIEYVNNTNLFLDQSVVLGDTRMDEGMMSIVGTAVALNPSEELRITAQEKKWYVRDHTNILEFVRNF